MLYMDIVCSFYVYVKIKSINVEEVFKILGVIVVVMGKDLEKYNLYWMLMLMLDM